MHLTLVQDDQDVARNTRITLQMNLTYAIWLFHTQLPQLRGFLAASQASLKQGYSKQELTTSRSSRFKFRIRPQKCILCICGEMSFGNWAEHFGGNPFGTLWARMRQCTQELGAVSSECTTMQKLSRANYMHIHKCTAIGLLFCCIWIMLHIHKDEFSNEFASTHKSYTHISYMPIRSIYQYISSIRFFPLLSWSAEKGVDIVDP